MVLLDQFRCPAADHAVEVLLDRAQFLLGQVDDALRDQDITQRVIPAA